jgi:HSP20 family protein
MKTAIESRANQTQYRRVRPIVDVYESEAEYLVSVELPGVKNEDVALTLEQDALRLEATRRANLNEPVVYDRSFSLPEGVDRERVNAQLKDGVLALKLPKRPSSQPRQIQVSAA